MSATAVHSLWTMAGGVTSAAPKEKFNAPVIEYAQLTPVLIVIGVAVVGVLVEAFVPRRARYYTQVFLTVVALAAAFAAVVGLAAGGTARRRHTSPRWVPSPSTDLPCSCRAPSC